MLHSSDVLVLLVDHSLKVLDLIIQQLFAPLYSSSSSSSSLQLPLTDSLSSSPSSAPSSSSSSSSSLPSPRPRPRHSRPAGSFPVLGQRAHRRSLDPLCSLPQSAPPRPRAAGEKVCKEHFHLLTRFVYLIGGKIFCQQAVDFILDVFNCLERWEGM